jgi:hypothetical protein
MKQDTYVEITWLDSSGRGGWCWPEDEAEFVRTSVKAHVTVGLWRPCAKKNWVLVALSGSPNGAHSAHILIPRFAIRKIRKLK